jgi:hypothetical protein
MSNSNSSASSGGIGLFTVVGIVFVVLKLVGVAPIAGWSWLWVLSPFWIGFVLAIAFLVLFVGLGAFFSWLANR